MFKKFIQRIIASGNKQEAWEKVFYGTIWNDGKITEYGIDIAYQHGKISLNEYEMIIGIIKKMA